MSTYWEKRSYAQQSTDVDGLSERGLVYLMAQKFSIASPGSVAFSLNPNGANLEIHAYTLSNTGETCYAELIESASATSYGTAIPGRNLNRNYTDTHTAVLKSASAVSGGTVIANELFGSEKASGAENSGRVHALNASRQYVMNFTNLGNQATTCHINLVWSENEPDHYNLIRNVTD